MWHAVHFYLLKKANTCISCIMFTSGSYGYLQIIHKSSGGTYSLLDKALFLT